MEVQQNPYEASSLESNEPTSQVRDSNVYPYAHFLGRIGRALGIPVGALSGICLGVASFMSNATNSNAIITGLLAFLIIATAARMVLSIAGFAIGLVVDLATNRTRE